MKNLLLSALCIIALFSNGCRSSNKVSSAEFGKYISGFTSGKVDLDGEIKIELSADIIDSIPTEKKDSAFLKDHIRISPKVKGSFYWINYRTIGFKPTNIYDQFRNYHVKFELGDFIKTTSKFQTFEFNFETDKQQLDISDIGLKINNTYDLAWQHYELLVHSNIELDTQKLAAIFSAKEEDRTLPVSYAQTAPKYYKITIDSILRKNKAVNVAVKWNAKKLDIDSKGSKEISIPGMGNFKVINMAVQDDGDQQVNITFSDPIAQNQNFDGLIEVEDAHDLKFGVNGNIVTVYLQERIEGAKHITVNKGVLNYGNYKMDSTNSGILNFAGIKPALRMDSKGCILPNSQGLLFPFESIGIHTIDVRIIKIKEKNIHQFLQVNDLDGEDGLTRVGKIMIEKTVQIIADTIHPQNQWTTHILDLDKLIKAEPGSLYRVCIRFQKKYTYLACRNQKSEETQNDYTYEEEPKQDSTWNEYNWHGNGFDGYNTWRWDDDDPCSDNYYYGGAISRNILASDIGVMYQEEKNKECSIVTTNLLTATALGNTEVNLYNFTKDLIASGITNNEGMLHLRLSEKPFLLVAKKGEQRAYLKLTNYNTLSLSKFDIEGVDQQNGVKGFLYAERGVWRPGDSVFLNFMLNDKDNPIPVGHPVKFELSNPDGATILSKTVTENSGHLYPLYFKTSPNAKLGNYQAKVTVGNATFSKNILLEYIVPNRMKLKSNVDGQILTAKDSLIYLKVNWLNGATGKGLKAQTSVNVKPDWNFFNKYPDYTFIAPYNSDFYGNYELTETKTNDSGIAKFIQSQATTGAPGILKETYVFKAFEQGGGFSIDKAEANISLFDSYVGLRKPTGENYYGSFDYNKLYAFPYVVLDKNQAIVNGHHLHLKIYEMQRSNWYEADNSDVATFKTYDGKICIKDTQWVATKGEGTFSFGNIGKNYGRYMIVLKDLASGHETGMNITFDNPYWDRDNSEDADYETIVQLSANKKSYKVGEQIELNVPAPQQANILINVESDSKIIKQFWTKGSKNGTSIRIATTKEMAPGIYIHATVLQPHNYTKDGSPIRQYGVMPIQVIDPDSRLIPVITMQDEIRPEVNNTLRITEQNGKEMNYSLVLVDEGLLDLTHYKLPKIWEYMNARQSLKVKTWDMYNQVIGAYAGKIQNVFTIGGDGSYEETEGTKANRFPPAIVNLGTFHINAREQKSHTFKIPNYCGSMKVIVVAYSDHRSGSAEKQFYVKKPLMLLTSAPRMMSAKEQYIIPVTVFNMEKKAKTVKVSMETTGLSNLHTKTEQTITFTGEGDAVANFNLLLPEETGVLTMNIKASDGKETTQENLQIQIKPTRPAINHLKSFSVNSDATIALDISPKGMKGTYRARLSISDKINFDFQNQLNYLIQYPHGCVEQTTSSAFAQLFLNDIEDVNDEEAKAIKSHIEIVLRKLQQFQTYNGGFAYWPYQDDVNDYASVYVFHFLMEARDKGFEVSDYVWKNALDYQQKCAKDYSNSFTNDSYYYYDREETQAYRLYLLSRLNIPDITAMNKLRAGNLTSNTAIALLAKAYSLTGKNDVARSLLLIMKTSNQKQQDYGNTFGSNLRDESLTLIALNGLGSKAYCQNIADNVSARLSNQNWNSTLSTSLALTALSKYYSLDKPTQKKYELGGKQYSFNKHNQDVAIAPSKDIPVINFKNRSATNLNIKLIERYSDTGDRQTLINNGIHLKIAYTDMKNTLIKESRLLHGSNFIAKLTVTNTTNTNMSNIALEYGIANGWQILSNRYMDDKTINKNSAADYSEAKDDGMYYYFSLSPKETKTYYVLLNASFKGTFYLPMAQCYPMYNETYKAQVAGEWVRVTE